MDKFHKFIHKLPDPLVHYIEIRRFFERKWIINIAFKQPLAIQKKLRFEFGQEHDRVLNIQKIDW